MTGSWTALNFMIVTCEVCKKEFRTDPCNIKKGWGRFCKRECYTQWQQINLKREKSPRWKGGLVEKICPICGGRFNAKKSEIKKGWGKFCDIKCRGIYHSKKMKDHGNSNWKGGINPIINELRNSKKYFLWRKQVFERDNFICQECGNNKGGNMQAHHLKKFSIIIQDIKQKYPLLSISDIAFNYSDLWNIKNGITLCKTCHKKKHQRII